MTTTEFTPPPLYTAFFNQTKPDAASLTSKEAAQVVSWIKKLDAHGQRKLFVIIFSYRYIYQLKFPISFDQEFYLDEFPTVLQCMVKSFTQAHLEEMRQERIRLEIEESKRTSGANE